MSLTARDAMQARVNTVDPEMKLTELESELMDKHATGFPVVEDGQLVGVVSRSDVVRRLAVERSYAGQIADYYHDVLGEVSTEASRRSFEAEAAQVGIRLADLTVQEIMTRDVISVTPDQPIGEVARLLIERKIHRVPVVDDGRLVGILSSVDIVRLVADGRLGSG